MTKSEASAFMIRAVVRVVPRLLRNPYKRFPSGVFAERQILSFQLVSHREVRHLSVRACDSSAHSPHDIRWIRRARAVQSRRAFDRLSSRSHARELRFDIAGSPNPRGTFVDIRPGRGMLSGVFARRTLPRIQRRPRHARKADIFVYSTGSRRTAECAAGFCACPRETRFRVICLAPSNTRGP